MRWSGWRICGESAAHHEFEACGRAGLTRPTMSCACVHNTCVQLGRWLSHVIDKQPRTADKCYDDEQWNWCAEVRRHAVLGSNAYNTGLPEGHSSRQCFDREGDSQQCNIGRVAVPLRKF